MPRAFVNDTNILIYMLLDTNIHATNICLKGSFSLASLSVVPAYKNEVFWNIEEASRSQK